MLLVFSFDFLNPNACARRKPSSSELTGSATVGSKDKLTTNFRN